MPCKVSVSICASEILVAVRTCYSVNISVYVSRVVRGCSEWWACRRKGSEQRSSDWRNICRAWFDWREIAVESLRGILGRVLDIEGVWLRRPARRCTRRDLIWAKLLLGQLAGQSRRDDAYPGVVL
jgi:hypothetical protein